MHLRHIDPHTTEWMDAMLDEGKGDTEAELETSSEDQAVSAAPLMAAPLAKGRHQGPPVHDGPRR
jgi:hypothetical protein